MEKKISEAKGDPWKVLAKDASAATKATGGGTWNNKKARKPGDTLIGTVGETRDTVTGFGPGKVMEITDREGEKHGVFLSEVLRNAIANVGGFSKGDRVFVKYLGVPSGKRYATYAVGKA